MLKTKSIARSSGLAKQGSAKATTSKGQGPAQGMRANAGEMSLVQGVTRSNIVVQMHAEHAPPQHPKGSVPLRRSMGGRYDSKAKTLKAVKMRPKIACCNGI